ncbi:hypothetical protein AXYL_03764 [Achromobacter xylosoxidans A8]|uniref:Uncharacterized protein n=1 Tax=Achromobacter xylosoxidans (strain A8) TaxID=762376 RepID=E3HNP5_ACHXA|nr:hypothetical protein [Achromobacter xylosoxidans]ADP17084.1 hypothetical protein AXYL_03764 [Achromobacter xylosoxidans A8]
MSSRPRKASPEQTALLTAAFPARLRAEAAHIAEEICPSVMSGRGLSVIVQDEPLTLPYRVQHGGSDSLFSKLDEPQALIYACMQSRHHDGHVRQRQIERLAGASEPWVVPFVVQLCSEYLVEILQDIEARLPLLDKRVYGPVLRSNPAFLDLAQQRMTSYWDCYYRRRGVRSETYVGFRLFKQFHDWQVSG